MISRLKYLSIILCLVGVYAAGVWKRPLFTPFSGSIPYLALMFHAKTDPLAIQRLDQVRRCTRRRYRITSAYRSAEHNSEVRGAKRSEHLRGRAFDILVPIDQRGSFYRCAKEAGFKGFGWGSNIAHIDLGPRRWWTYDDQGQHLSGSKKHRYLHKAPPEFLRDFRLVCPSQDE